jgi:GMP synthase (glutamine-hydrolysing)
MAHKFIKTTKYLSPMNQALIIQNDPPETLGLYEKYLHENTDLTIIRAYNMKQKEQFPPIENFTHFIVGPTPISANDAFDHPFLQKEWIYLKKIIKSAKPCLGVCCGGQMLAKILGGEVKKSPSKEIGSYSAQITDEGLNDPLFKDFPREIPVFHWHSEMFTVPPGGKLLATGNPCPIQAFNMSNIRGVIFHLEITVRDAQRWTKAYPKEPSSIGKTIQQVLEECQQKEQQMKQLSLKLMKNFLEM